jgi:sulfate permease, SulP family
MNARSLWSPFASINKLTTLRPDTFKADLVAGVTVSLVAIPQSLAYAQLAGVPAYYGLYAALIRRWLVPCSVLPGSYRPARSQ